jgi:hypothetical protein
VHFWVGYTNPFHVAPAVAGAGQFLIGIALSARRMLRSPDRIGGFVAERFPSSPDTSRASATEHVAR